MPMHNRKRHFRLPSGVWTVMLLLVNVVMFIAISYYFDADASRMSAFLRAIEAPLSSQGSVLMWAAITAYMLLAGVVAFFGYKHNASDASQRRLHLFTALIGFLGFLCTGIIVIGSLFQHNYAAAAAFATAWAVLFTALKLMGAGAVTKIGADFYDLAKKRVFKPKTGANQPTA